MRETAREGNDRNKESGRERWDRVKGLYGGERDGLRGTSDRK